MENPPMAGRDLRKTWMQVLLGAAWASAALLFLWRLWHTISFHLPALCPTTGCEEEVFFSVWKFTRGQAVYNDPLQIPFSVSSYNWAFYYLYGAVCKGALRVLHLDAAWIPTIGRLLTLGFGLASCRIFFLILRQNPRVEAFWSRPLIILLCCTPLISVASGYWVMTVRPDTDAITFELAGLLFIVRYLRGAGRYYPWLAAISFYGAWSFKHANVSMIAGSCLALLLLRDWRALFLIVGVWVVLVAGTLEAGGAFYRFALLTSQMNLPFLPRQGVMFTLSALTRDPFLLVSLSLAAWCLVRRPQALLREPAALTLVCASFCALALGLVTIMKVGAAPYYFIPLGTWSFLFFLDQADQIPDWARQFAAVCAAILIVRIVTLNFILGHEMLTEMRQPFQDLTLKLATLPGPTIVSDQGGNLPWIQTKPPYFVVTAMYGKSKVPLPYADGGLAGLLKDGYFRTVVKRKGEDWFPVSKAYEPFYEDVNFIYYRRAEAAGSPADSSQPR